MRNLNFLVALLASFTIGAIINHGLFVLIHECTHNLVFKSTRQNKIAALIANIPIAFPLAMGFRQYHLLHHSHKGDPQFDGDIPYETEARWVGSSPFRKVIWMAGFFLVEGVIRPVRFKKKVFPFQSWARENFACQFLVMGTLLTVAPQGAIYLLLSSCFALGLHPLGARFIQEHSVVVPGQETYSYYGICNRFIFNAGYHHEHHDLPTISWDKLPVIRQIAPEFYDGLAYHTSYLKLLFSFFTQAHFNLYGRVVRARQKAGTR
jgi:sphingolipid delta-4 desaturase